MFPPRLARPCSRNRIVAFYACACALTVCRLSAYVRAPLPLSAGMPCTMLQLCMHAPHATFDKLLLRTAPSRPCAPAPGGRLRRPCGACGHWRDTCITKRAQNDFFFANVASFEKPAAPERIRHTPLVAAKHNRQNRTENPLEMGGAEKGATRGGLGHGWFNG